MRINTNLTAMNTYTQYTKNSNKIAGAVAKLSSGYTINSAADNATGLAISEKMRAQIRGLDRSNANAQDAISLVQTAEGALSSSTEILQRMRELAVQSSSDTNENKIDRTALQDEFSQLQSELSDVAKNTTFNKKTLLDGSLATETKNLGETVLGNSGMTISLGNAATGKYNFNVSTKLVSAAVTEAKAATPELVTDGASTYFSGTNTATLGSNAGASDLLNGNYTLKATYADPTNDKGDGQIKVTATGDNGQKFQATITKDDLTALAGGTSLAIRFNAEADDAFNLSLNLKSTVAASESNYDTLASNISKLTVSVTGGVTAREAEYGVFANLTGAESVRLESAMDSVTFGNGVKVNFDTLTASGVDATNKASVSSFTLTGAPASFTASIATNNPWNNSMYSVEMGTMGPGAPDVGDYTISATRNVADDGFDLVATHASGNYTASLLDVNMTVMGWFSYPQFTDVATSTKHFTLEYTKSAGATFPPPAKDLETSFTNVDGTASGATGWILATALTNPTVVQDNAVVQNYHITAAIDSGTNVATLTAHGTDGTNYTATLNNTTVSALATGATFNADFYDASSNHEFTVTYTVGNGDARDLSNVSYEANITATTGAASGATGQLAVDAGASSTNLANQAYTTTVSESGGMVSLTTTGGTDGKTYNSAVKLSDLAAGAKVTAAFDDTDGNAAFSIDYTVGGTALTGGAGGTAVASLANTFTLSTVGHNYETVFGTGRSASSFSVEAQTNKGLTFQVGANQGDEMTINIDKMDANYLGVASASVATRTAASSAISAVDAAINQVSSQRAYLGAIQNRLDYKISNLETSTENLTSAESQIRDVDMAKEMTSFTNANILQQAATAMLAQANSLPQNVLSLIKG